jgi:hypothetical protein
MSNRTRAMRRHQVEAHLWRRLKEDRNQHYARLNCPCYTDPKAMARFKEQPAVCSGPCCGNPRRWNKGADRATIQERRAPICEVA